MVFCPSYNLPKKKKKKKDKAYVYLSKDTKFGGYLWNGKVLDIHSAQTKSGLLDSHDQCTLYAWYGWYVAYITNLTKLSHINLFMNVYSSFKKKSDIFLWIKKIDL